jgi:hypothetical protein
LNPFLNWASLVRVVLHQIVDERKQGVDAMPVLTLARRAWWIYWSRVKAAVCRPFTLSSSGLVKTISAGRQAY